MKKIKVYYGGSDRDGNNVYESAFEIYVHDKTAAELNSDEKHTESHYRLHAIAERMAELHTHDTFARATVEGVEILK